MTVTLDAAGLTVQSYSDILEEIVVQIGIALSLTPPQVQRVRASVQSTLGQIARIEAEREAALQETMAAVYDTLSLYASGASLDRVAALMGVTRLAASASYVTGTATGLAGVVIPNGTRLQYNPEETVWTVVDGPYTVGGGGTVTIAVEGDSSGDWTVALDPDTGFDDWTLLDTIPNFTSFESSAQPVTGAPIETDAGVRSRYSIEAYRRAQGPIKAIEAAIQDVTGVTFVRVWENRTATTDADGIPGHAINAVVEGGDVDEIGAAIFAARPAGAEVFALVDGSEETPTVTDDYGFGHVMGFNRITPIDIWINCVLTTSTSEETPPADLETTVQTAILAGVEDLFGIGDDVLPWKIAGLVYALGLDGIDNVTVTLSTNGISYSSAKRSISIRERSAFTSGRTTVSQA